MSIAGNAIIGLSAGNINYNNVNTLTINAGNGANNYTISSTAPGTATMLNAGSGNDSILVGSAAHTLDGIQGALTLTAGNLVGLNIDDQGSGAARTFTVSGTGIAWPGGPSVTYSGMGSLVVNGGTGGNTFNVSGSSVATALGGGSPSGNMVVGSASPNSWELTAANAGKLTGAAYAAPVTFTQMQNLTAGPAGDYFLFDAAADISGNLAGGGTSALDYTPYTTSVVVDLQQPGAVGLNTGVGGTLNGVRKVTGGSGAPGTAGLYNLLIGNGGNTLTGGTGRRNILVSGATASTLNAGDGEDLLIGGSTNYDTEAALVSWLQIANYWAGADPYATRVFNVTGGIGVPLLDATTVTGNGGGNAMNGLGALALIYTDGADVINGFDPGSQSVAINP